MPRKKGQVEKQKISDSMAVKCQLRLPASICRGTQFMPTVLWAMWHYAQGCSPRRAGMVTCSTSGMSLMADRQSGTVDSPLSRAKCIRLKLSLVLSPLTGAARSTPGRA